MGHNYFTVTMKDRPPQEHRFGVLIQTVKGVHSWFMTVHKATTSHHQCEICDRTIKRGEPYIRNHTLRFEMTGQPAIERVCRDCFGYVERNRNIKIEVSEG